MARGDFDEARPALERARAATRSPDVLESLAWSLARGGHLAEAAAAYEELLSTKPLGDEAQAYWLGAHVELGRIYEALGDAEKAAGSYRALIELWRDGDPELPLLLAARERLEALGT